MSHMDHEKKQNHDMLYPCYPMLMLPRANHGFPVLCHHSNSQSKLQTGCFKGQLLPFEDLNFGYKLCCFDFHLLQSIGCFAAEVLLGGIE